MPDEARTATCYLLIGGADGALSVTLRAADGKIAELNLRAESGFGGTIWQVVAQMLVDTPLDHAALRQRIAQMRQTGLLPEELNLDPLVKTLLNLGKR